MLTDSRAHLRQAGETYFEHLRFAALVGAMLVGAGLACILHALIPALCTRTASRMVDQLGGLFRDRSTLLQVVDQSSGSVILVGLLLLSVPSSVLLVLLATSPAFASGVAALALAIPAAYLWSNPGLEAVR